jgi:hypothetical protein
LPTFDQSRWSTSLDEAYFGYRVNIILAWILSSCPGGYLLCRYRCFPDPLLVRSIADLALALTCPTGRIEIEAVVVCVRAAWLRVALAMRPVPEYANPIHGSNAVATATTSKPIGKTTRPAARKHPSIAIGLHQEAEMAVSAAVTLSGSWRPNWDARRDVRISPTIASATATILILIAAY